MIWHFPIALCLHFSTSTMHILHTSLKCNKRWILLLFSLSFLLFLWNEFKGWNDAGQRRSKKKTICYKRWMKRRNFMEIRWRDAYLQIADAKKRFKSRSKFHQTKQRQRANESKSSSTYISMAFAECHSWRDCCCFFHVRSHHSTIWLLKIPYWMQTCH
jgi:hypothetical protein